MFAKFGSTYRPEKIRCTFVSISYHIVPYHTNKGLIYLYFCILAYCLFTVRFIQLFFSQIKNDYPLKYVWFVQRYSVFYIDSV